MFLMHSDSSRCGKKLTLRMECVAVNQVKSRLVRVRLVLLDRRTTSLPPKPTKLLPFEKVTKPCTLLWLQHTIIGLCKHSFHKKCSIFVIFGKVKVKKWGYPTFWYLSVLKIFTVQRWSALFKTWLRMLRGW